MRYDYVDYDGMHARMNIFYEVAGFKENSENEGKKLQCFCHKKRRKNLHVSSLKMLIIVQCGTS